MFNSLFKKNKSSVPNNTSEVGATPNNPVLLCSIATSYVYLDALCSIANGLEYVRVGTVNEVGFPETIDHFHFTLNGNSFCDLYIYSYHNDNEFWIPSSFKQLDPSVKDSIFELDDSAHRRYLMAIAEMVMTQKGIHQHQEEVWNPEKNHLLTKLRTDLGYKEELEKLIIDEYWEMKKQYPEILKYDFIGIFVESFHNKKLVKYTPEFIQERNQKILEAYNAIIETINRIQGWNDKELVRRRIEFSTIESNNYLLGYSVINRCITPFCFINLGCDKLGIFNIVYGLDYRILDMLPGNMASTLIRRIYEFTPGELEPFVDFASLDMDCITYFNESLQIINIENCILIEVSRNDV